MFASSYAVLWFGLGLIFCEAFRDISVFVRFWYVQTHINTGTPCLRTLIHIYHVLRVARDATVGEGGEIWGSKRPTTVATSKGARASSRASFTIIGSVA